MATIYESNFCNLIIVPKDDPRNTDGTPLTFTEYRSLMAENIISIDSRIHELTEKNNQLLSDSKNYAENLVSSVFVYDEESSDGGITIGGNGGYPIHFNDGTTISTLSNGKLNVKSVEVTDGRFGDYVVKSNSVTKHFQITYQPL